MESCILWLLKSIKGNSVSTRKHLKAPVIASACTVVWEILEKCKARSGIGELPCFLGKKKFPLQDAL